MLTVITHSYREAVLNKLNLLRKYNQMKKNHTLELMKFCLLATIICIM